MKKILALVLALCLLCGSFALAAEYTTGTQAEMCLSTWLQGGSLNNGFIVYIPEGFEIESGSVTGTGNVRLEVYNTDSWDMGYKVQVLLNRTENFDYGYDEDDDHNWHINRLVMDDYNRIDYTIYKNGNEDDTIWPWQSDEHDGMDFGDGNNHEILKYIFSDYVNTGSRNQTTNLTFKLCVGDEYYAAGYYEDTLTFNINFGYAHCIEAYYEADVLYVPVPKVVAKEDYSYYRVNHDEDGNVYYSRWKDGGYIYLNKDFEEVDPSTIGKIAIDFYDWDESITGDGWQVDDENDPMYGQTLYTPYEDMGEPMFCSASWFLSHFDADEFNTNWFQDLYFVPSAENNYPWPV